MDLCIWWAYGIYGMALYTWWTYGIYGIPDYLVLPSLNALMHTYLLTYYMGWLHGFMHKVDIWDIWDGFIYGIPDYLVSRGAP